MTVTAQPTRISRMGLRQRPGRVVSLSAIPSSGHFEGANITASSTEPLRLTRIQAGPSRCLLPPLNRARTCRWLVWAGATAGAGKHVKYAADGVDRVIDLLGRVCGAEEEAHARRAFRHRRMDDRSGENALGEERLRETGGAAGCAAHAWHARRAGAVPGIEAARLRPREEMRRDPAQPGDALRLGVQQAERGERGTGICRRQADAVEEAGRRVFQVLNEGARAGDVAAAARQRLAQRTHPDVDIGGGDGEMLADAEAALAEHAEGMRLVDHEEGLVAALPLNEAWQGRRVTRPSVETFESGEEAVALCGRDAKT